MYVLDGLYLEERGEYISNALGVIYTTALLLETVLAQKPAPRWRNGASQQQLRQGRLLRGGADQRQGRHTHPGAIQGEVNENIYAVHGHFSTQVEKLKETKERPLVKLCERRVGWLSLLL